MPRSMNCIPAAQYLRMSTERQEYSLDNQATAIKDYADTHDFEIVRTYADAGRSGLVLNERRGLQSLLALLLAKEIAPEAATPNI